MKFGRSLAMRKQVRFSGSFVGRLTLEGSCLFSAHAIEGDLHFLAVLCKIHEGMKTNLLRECCTHPSSVNTMLKQIPKFDKFEISEKLLL